uniref:Uncharacterized protein n=1 Tax=Arundo donax TaxID=35708 RepID=A0A0A9BTW9_ARUDO
MSQHLMHQIIKPLYVICYRPCLSNVKNCLIRWLCWSLSNLTPIAWHNSFQL